MSSQLIPDFGFDSTEFIWTQIPTDIRGYQCSLCSQGVPPAFAVLSYTAVPDVTEVQDDCVHDLGRSGLFAALSTSCSKHKHNMAYGE